MAIVVDAHSDILNDIYPRRLLGERKILENFWIPKMIKGGIDIRILALYSESQFLPELALRRALDLISMLYEEIQSSSKSILCTNFKCLKEATEEKKIGFILGMEGSEPLGSDIQLLRIFYKLGLRVLGLTHTLRTYLADGAPLKKKNKGREGGLTEAGIEFLEEAQKMGILIDVSHLNDSSFWDVIKFKKSPIIASHSNCRSLCHTPRNISDKQIKAIADSGGVIGINSCSLLVQGGTLEDLLNHIDHLANKGGIEHTGLGLDFADYLYKYMTEPEKKTISYEWIKPVDGLSGDEDVPKITEKLSKRGYKPREIDLIMGENFIRLFKEILK